MYTEDDLVPLSALQHLVFCERRVALIYLEGVWADNEFTAEGTVLHERVHTDHRQVDGQVRTVRGLALRSFALGVSGKADVVEFRLVEDVRIGTATWEPFPVEYKRGRLRKEDGYEVHVCAQALCLEEMLGIEVPRGALYYGKTRRRLRLEFDERLRSTTVEAAKRLHDLLGAGVTPKARRGAKCRRCSLEDECLPQILGPRRSARKYLVEAIAGVPEVPSSSAC